MVRSHFYIFLGGNHMALQLRTVTVRRLQETTNSEQEWAFLEELKSSLHVERPRIVLNCAEVRSFSHSSLRLLLCCLEEAMKRNGDVRLSTLSQSARAALESSGMERLFQVFEDDAAAVKSFQRLPILTIPQSQAVATSPEGCDVAVLSIEATENVA
jgi:anti-anti-sigma factor